MFSVERPIFSSTYTGAIVPSNTLHGKTIRIWNSLRGSIPFRGPTLFPGPFWTPPYRSVPPHRSVPPYLLTSKTPLAGTLDSLSSHAQRLVPHTLCSTIPRTYPCHSGKRLGQQSPNRPYRLHWSCYPSKAAVSRQSPSLRPQSASTWVSGIPLCRRHTHQTSWPHVTSMNHCHNWTRVNTCVTPRSSIVLVLTADSRDQVFARVVRLFACQKKSLGTLWSTPCAGHGRHADNDSDPTEMAADPCAEYENVLWWRLARPRPPAH